MIPLHPPGASVAEIYENSLYHYQPQIKVARWWVPDFPIMVGGSVIDAADWEHLRRDFGIEHCINVETEHDDSAKVPAGRLLQAQVSDDHAPPIPHDAIAKVLSYACAQPADAKLYVHCQMGGSRSPAFAYLILRGKYGLDQAQALAALNRGFMEREKIHLGDAAEPFGGGADGAKKEGHWRYINSIEAYLATRPGPNGGEKPEPTAVTTVEGGAKKIAILYPTLAMSRPLDVNNMMTDARGLTGSEMTAVQYALGLSALGHNVTMFCNVTADQAYRGVRFQHDQHWEPSQADGYDAVISFMNAAPLFGVPANVLRIFNMQCGDFGGQPAGWEQHVDLLCSLSHTHAKEMRPTTALPSDKWRVMYNGVDTEAFRPGTKIPGRCIWASSHDRGLHHVLEAWPEIRIAVPHAELHVFYDAHGLERFANMGPTDVPFLAELQRRSVYELEMLRRLKNHGVFMRGSVSREHMQLEMASAEVLAYACNPVRFTETYGCTVVEAMASGCVPVLCFADAFPELWESRGCPGVAWPYEEHRDEWVARTINALRHPEQWAAPLREKASEFAWGPLVKALEKCIETRGAEGMERPEFSDAAVTDYVLYRPYFERAA